MSPKPHDAPTETPQLTEVGAIAPARTLDLLFPVRRQFLTPQREAPAVPEIAVHEHH
jgi:hypothetical protein